MKIFLSYKQSWVKEQELKRDLSFIRESLSELWLESFIYYLDISWKKTPKEVLEIAREKIEKSDIVICFVNYEELSEGMMLELWIAYDLKKDVILLINKKISFPYFLLKSFAKKIIEFDKLEDIKEKLESSLQDCSNL